MSLIFNVPLKRLVLSSVVGLAALTLVACGTTPVVTPRDSVSMQNFQTVRPGMSHENVVSRLGLPLVKTRIAHDTDTYEYVVQTRKDIPATYAPHLITFKGGRVVKTGAIE